VDVISGDEPLKPIPVEIPQRRRGAGGAPLGVPVEL
jgi:hypothetical protein